MGVIVYIVFLIFWSNKKQQEHGHMQFIGGQRPTGNWGVGGSPPREGVHLSTSEAVNTTDALENRTAPLYTLLHSGHYGTARVEENRRPPHSVLIYPLAFCREV